MVIRGETGQLGTAALKHGYYGVRRQLQATLSLIDFHARCIYARSLATSLIEPLNSLSTG